MTEWHLITGEYPPQHGGVSDYTRLVASGLAAAGDAVHVWCPHSDASLPEDPGVIVHRELGTMSPPDLLRAGRMLDEFPGPRKLLVQWVPHAFGFRSANLPLSLWIWKRALEHKDSVEVMVHEPYLPLRQRRLAHTALAIAHRVMLAAILRAASHVWVAIPKWEEYCRPYTFGRRVSFSWLPVISNIPVDEQDAQVVRERYAPEGGVLIGHFGACSGAIGASLHAIIPELLNNHSDRTILLIGREGQQLRDALMAKHPEFGDRIHSTGSLSSREISLHISACDLMVQPYPDGASSRRSGLLAALSHGRPIVTTSGPLTEPLWHEADAVVLTAAGQDSEIITAVNNLLADPSERERLSAAARITYTRWFGLASTVQVLRNRMPVASAFHISTS